VGAIPYFDATTPEPYSNRARPPGTGDRRWAAPRPTRWRRRSSWTSPTSPTDGGQTTFFYDRTSPSPRRFRFYGTSEAAPHAAAVAALLRSCNPSLTAAEVVTAMKDTAAPVANGVPEASARDGSIAKAAGDSVCLPPPPGPTFNVSDASVQEGNGGFAPPRPWSSRSRSPRPPPRRRRLKYATANGTAVAPGDYTAKSLTSLSFTAGQTSKTVSVTVKGDTVYEPDEGMSLVLSSPVGAAIGDGVGIGTIFQPTTCSRSSRRSR